MKIFKKKSSLGERFKSFITLNDIDFANPEERRVAEMLSAVLVCMIGCILILASIMPLIMPGNVLIVVLSTMLTVAFMYGIALKIARTRHYRYAGFMIILVCLVSTTIPALNLGPYASMGVQGDEVLRPVLFTPIALFFATFIFGFKGTISITVVTVVVQKMLLLKYSTLAPETVQMLAMMDFITAALLGIFAKTNERHLKQINSQQAAVAAAAKMSSLGEMAGGIAHEINNPLAVIHARAIQIQKVLQNETPNLEEAMRFSNIIYAMSERIASIVKGMKTFSRDATNESPEKCSLKKIVEDTLVLCEQRFRLNGISLEVSSSIDNFYFEGKPVQISQVLLNLLNNSNDAIEEAKDKWVKIEGVAEANKLKIFITDSGKGIPNHVLEKIMQPFFTTKPVGKGTGLGLSVSQAIIRDHKGSLTIDVTYPHTRFVIEIPGEEKSTLCKVA